MWTDENRGRYDRSRLRYPSDLTDDEWSLVEPLIPPAKRGGNKRHVNLREVLNGLMYILSTVANGERCRRTCRHVRPYTIILICGVGTALSIAFITRSMSGVAKQLLATQAPPLQSSTVRA